jgi:hypothetical protein
MALENLHGRLLLSFNVSSPGAWLAFCDEAGSRWLVLLLIQNANNGLERA